MDLLDETRHNSLNLHFALQDFLPHRLYLVWKKGAQHDFLAAWRYHITEPMQATLAIWRLAQQERRLHSCGSANLLGVVVLAEHRSAFRNNKSRYTRLVC